MAFIATGTPKRMSPKESMRSPAAKSVAKKTLRLLLPVVSVCYSYVAAAAAVDSSRAATSSAAQPQKAAARLVIVAPEAFSPALLSLVAHKNRSGMSARLITMEGVRTNFPGRDDPERLKRAIVHANRDWGTRYVFLVGDASLMPVRYRQVQQVPKDAPHTGTYNPSELYYANLYQRHAPGNPPNDPVAIRDSGEFDSWDANGNGRFNEQHLAGHRRAACSRPRRQSMARTRG